MQHTGTHSETASVGRPVLASPTVPAVAWGDLLSAAQLRTLAIAVFIGLSLVVRCLHLDAYGFSEDETNKLRAAASYRQWDFSANAEHPMVMKLAMFASMQTAGAWNTIAPSLHAPAIADETALRLPNAIAGSLITGIIFLLCELLFGLPTAIWASLFWALDVNAAAINRIGKEDTFLLLFLLLGAYFYERAKVQTWQQDAPGAQRWFARSGGAFGLMLASKYMPHYFGLHALFAVAARDPHSGPVRARFFRAMGFAFLIANFAVILPATWSYLQGYVHGHMQTHTGYFFAQRLYENGVSFSPFGTPIWFYVTALITKIPLVPLGLIVLGLVQMFVHRRERGMVFLRVFLLFALIPYSFVASKFLRYLLPVFAMLDIIAAVGVVWLLGSLRRLLEQRTGRSSTWSLWRPRIAMAAVVVASVLDPLSALVSSAPFYSLHQNALAARFFTPGMLYPDDEFYDAGVREAVTDLARIAQPGAVIASDATNVVQVYLDRAGRTDLRSVSLSQNRLSSVQAPEIWVLAQDAHTYFENQATLSQLRARSAPTREYVVGGGVAVQVFQLPR